ncbi:MAG: hypothetical protein AAB792_02055 [Patescibacteria group bacterium]
MILKDNTKKIIILVIVLSFIANFGLPLKRAEAVIPVIDAANLTANTVAATMTTAQKIAYFLKEFIIYPLVRKLGNSLENKLLNKTNGLISGLTQKTPSFITNWRNYTLDSQARGNDVFRAILADATLCPYFKTNLQTAFGAEKSAGAMVGAKVKAKDKNGNDVIVYENKTSIPGLPSFKNLADCTLSSNTNVGLFRKDFSNGGWSAWNELIQPQNNFYGAYSLALGEQVKQIQTEKESAKDSSIAGQGFLGQQLGLTGGASPTGCVGASLPGVQRFSADTSGNLTNITRCAFMGKEVTPGQVLGKAAASALDKKLGRVGGATQVTDVILNLLNAVLSSVSNRMLNFIGQSSYQAQPPYSPQPTPPGGNTLNETPVPEPGSDPNACSGFCQGELNSCRASIATICTPGVIDPVTGVSEPDICAPDPDGEARCETQYNSCITQCSALP